MKAAFRHGRFVACLVALGTALGPGAMPVHAAEDPAALLVAGIGRLDTAWRVATVIRDLDARYGTFADLDGDGDRDYVATEMLHGPERVTTYLREADTWRRVARGGEELQGRHPLHPWVLADDGSGRAAIVVPVGWPPHLFLLRTDGAGGLVGPARPLGAHLPPRISRPAGVDNNPYRLTRVQAAGEGRPASIHGELQDESGGRGKRLAWTLELREDGRVRRTATRTLPAPPPLVEDTIPVAVQPARGPQACAHDLGRARAVLATHPLDVTRDGRDDLVHLTADLAAHVFPGGLDARGRRTFGEELVPARPVGARAAAATWPGPFAEGPAGRSGARREARRRDLRLTTPGTGTVALMARTRFGPPDVTTWFSTGRTLVPIHRPRRLDPRGPEATGDRADGWDVAWWREAWHDVTGDGVPDALAVGTGRPYDVDADGRRHRRGPGDVAVVAWWQGEGRDVHVQPLALLPGTVTTPTDWNAGMPIDLAPVRVEGTEATWRCIYLRDRRIGVFVAVDAQHVDPAEAARRTATRWLRRGEELLDGRGGLQACDHPGCVAGRGLQTLRVEDALYCFTEALRASARAATPARAHHGRARCLSLLERVDEAAGAYRAYLSSGGSAASFENAHADLDALFSDERFLAWLAARGK